jgi:hypothetical protein
MKSKEAIVDDQHMCVSCSYGPSRVLNLLTVCGEIRQTLDAKMRQLYLIYLRRINQSYYNCSVCNSFAGLYTIVRTGA